MAHRSKQNKHGQLRGGSSRKRLAWLGFEKTRTDNCLLGDWERNPFLISLADFIDNHQSVTISWKPISHYPPRVSHSQNRGPCLYRCQKEGNSHDQQPGGPSHAGARAGACGMAIKGRLCLSTERRMPADPPDAVPKMSPLSVKRGAGKRRPGQKKRIS